MPNKLAKEEAGHRKDREIARIGPRSNKATLLDKRLDLDGFVSLLFSEAGCAILLAWNRKRARNRDYLRLHTQEIGQDSATKSFVCQLFFSKKAKQSGQHHDCLLQRDGRVPTALACITAQADAAAALPDLCGWRHCEVAHGEK